MTTLGDELRITTNSVKNRKKAIGNHLPTLKSHVTTLLKETALTGVSSLICNFDEIYKSKIGIHGLIAQDFRKCVTENGEIDGAGCIAHDLFPTEEEVKYLMDVLKSYFTHSGVNTDRVDIMMIFNWEQKQVSTTAINGAVGNYSMTGPSGSTGMRGATGCTGPSGSA